ncbi:MAG: hypothetical protein EZS28_054961 [Streblomastix strix]|uniref:Uncharacterized protein n=1 Tax=Streblomastix strix TaxID=222440 RepID=A0A5J4QB74_9EUKA|nr:MAG: hypothetical protein EZS28_054961 [Streblomastix strix]
MLLDGMDRCDAKLDARIAGGQPCKTNKQNLVCFDQAYSDTAFEMRMSLKERIQDEIDWMNSESNITIAIDAFEQLHIDWHAIFKTIWEAAIKYACESKICH